MGERRQEAFERPDPSQDDAHVLLPAWLRPHVPPLYATEHQADPLVVAKYFTPDASWTWYLLESDGYELCFGLVDGLTCELGYFSLPELDQVCGPLGLPVERVAGHV
jgi:hypothetical protein